MMVPATGVKVAMPATGVWVGTTTTTVGGTAVRVGVGLGGKSLGSLGRVAYHAATATITIRAAASPPQTGQLEPNLLPGAFACLSGELFATIMPP